MSYNCHKAGAQGTSDKNWYDMDRSTRTTLWIAAIVLLLYFVWFFADCAMDDSCRIVCGNHGRGVCHTDRTPRL